MEEGRQEKGEKEDPIPEGSTFITQGASPGDNEPSPTTPEGSNFTDKP